MSCFFFRNLKRVYPTVKSARGVWITDSDSHTYLDGSSGAIVANLGHGLPEITQAITRQLHEVAFAHTSQFVSQPGLDLADKLVGLTKFGAGARVYFTSGGSESIETAIKMARSYFVERGELSRTLCISRWHSYHGSTLGALAVTGHPARRKPYVALLKDQPHISAAYPYRCRCGVKSNPCTSDVCALRCANELEEAIEHHGPENVMAFIAEPIVGAALGAVVPWESYWRRIADICTDHGVLLIADEVMTGLGRVGANFALDLWDVQPDIIALGKGLSAGYLPAGAVIATGNVVNSFETGSGIFEHGFTYSGHPTACAAGLAVIDYLVEHSLVASVAHRQKAFFDKLNQLAKYDVIGDIRGRGFMAGIEFVKNQQTAEPFPAHMRFSQLVAREAAAVGLLVYPGSGGLDGVLGDHIMIAPPFVISDEEMEELVNRLSKALESVTSSVSVKG